MYLLTMFDLPSKTKCQRRIYRFYKKKLLKLGVMRIQFSVYIKYVDSDTQANTLKQSIRKAMPKKGEVRTVQLTDNQYQKMETFSNNKQVKNAPPIEDFIVF